MAEGVEIDDRLLAAVMAASRALVAMVARSIEASPIEVTLAQYRALVVLAGDAPVHMAELARQLSLSPSSATRLVERLERKGLAQRATSAASRREVVIRLLPDGEVLISTVMTERRRQLTELLAGLPERQRDGMRRAFETLADLAGEPVDVSELLQGRRAAGKPA